MHLYLVQEALGPFFRELYTKTLQKHSSHIENKTFILLSLETNVTSKPMMNIDNGQAMKIFLDGFQKQTITTTGTCIFKLIRKSWTCEGLPELYQFHLNIIMLHNPESFQGSFSIVQILKI